MRSATLDDYRWLYAHGYMPDGLKCARGIMLDIVERCPATFLDYGCGRGDLVRWINEKTAGNAAGHDPGTGMTIPMFGEQPSYHWIVSCDVLEHLTPDELGAALRDFPRLASKGLLLTIANMNDVQAVDGEPVQLHLIREHPEWWIERINRHWPGCHIEHRWLDGERFALLVEFR